MIPPQTPASELLNTGAVQNKFRHSTCELNSSQNGHPHRRTRREGAGFSLTRLLDGRGLNANLLGRELLLVLLLVLHEGERDDLADGVLVLISFRIS